MLVWFLTVWPRLFINLILRTFGSNRHRSPTTGLPTTGEISIFRCRQHSPEKSRGWAKYGIWRPKKRAVEDFKGCEMTWLYISEPVKSWGVLWAYPANDLCAYLLFSEPSWQHVGQYVSDTGTSTANLPSPKKNLYSHVFGSPSFAPMLAVPVYTAVQKWSDFFYKLALWHVDNSSSGWFKNEQRMLTIIAIACSFIAFRSDTV